MATISSKREQEEKVLLQMWLSHKYWSACCTDEAIDWSNHQQRLDDYKEVADYVAWRDQVKSLTLQLHKLISTGDFEKVSHLFL